jgi:hypothetical protein
MFNRGYGPELGLRPNTHVKKWPIFYVFNQGGMGDFINYSSATTWVARNSPWLKVKLFCPKYIVPLMRDIHHEFEHWEVFPSEDFEKHMKQGQAMKIICPDLHVNGHSISKQYLTCTGAHAIDVGFAYYAGMTSPPGAVLPVLDYPASLLQNSVKDLNGGYVVIPTGNVHAARAVTGKHVNPLIEYVLKIGLMPVFLGKKDLLGDGMETTRFPDDVRYDLGLDLRDKTTVKEAACILQHAIATIGLDCGLLHLAALMKDSNVVFGYNITTVAHRIPRRNHGTTINVSLVKEELPCIGCQSNLRMVQHEFDKCLYGDSLCIDLLYKNNAEKFTNALDIILEGAS